MCIEIIDGPLMLQKTRGIVLKTTDYSETSLVVKIYTEDFGLQSYIVNSVRKKNAKFRSGLFEPLTQVELVAYHKESGGLQRISEIRNGVRYMSIPFDPVKSSMVIFLNELLYRTLREGEGDQSLYGYLSNSLELLDLQQPVSNAFHFSFLLGLTRHLGFQPNGFCTPLTPYFDLQGGSFCSEPPLHPHYLDREESALLDGLLRATMSSLKYPSMDAAVKRKLLDRLVDYFRLHVAGLGEIRSHKVLEEIWD
ncbi:MAG: DNA repair protein RecO [Bacteroidota bacterium]